MFFFRLLRETKRIAFNENKHYNEMDYMQKKVGLKHEQTAEFGGRNQGFKLSGENGERVNLDDYR